MQPPKVSPITAQASENEPYPQSLSAKEPLKFFAAEKSLEILILNAKSNQDHVSNRQFDEALKELNLIANEVKLPENMKLAMNQLIAQFKDSAKPEGNRMKVDVAKIQAILDALQRS